MGFRSSLGVVVLLWAGVIFMIAMAFGRLLKLHRIYLEGVGIGRAAKRVRRFLDRDQTGGVKFCVRQSYYYDEILPEEEAGMPEICVVCREYGRRENEDARPPLVAIDGSYIPLCSGHKEFVREFEENIKERVLSVKNGEEEIPSV